MLDRTKFAKICDGLSSPNPTARAVAAAKATGVLHALDLSWSDVLAGKNAPADRETLQSLHGMQADAIITVVAERLRALSPGDQAFVRTLQRAKRPRALSRFQWAILMRIALQSGGVMPMEAAE